MAYADRVKESSTSTGTGSLSLAGAASGFRTFAAGFTVGATMPYAISDALGNWEIGTGTLSASTTLARTTVLASSNGNALVNFPAGSKDVFCTLSAAQIAAFQVSQDIAFATAIPLTVAGTQYMPQQSVASVLAFTVASSPVKGASVYVRLLADGTNAPTFTGMKEWGGSLGYDNRNQIANQVQFFFDGTDTFYSISQAVGAVPTPAAASGVTMTGPTSGVASTASTSFSVGVTPVGGTITGSVVVTPSDSSGGGTFSPTSVSLSSGAPTGTFTYTPNSTVTTRTISVTNNGGLSNPSNISYSVTAAATVPGAPTIGTATGGDASASVTFTAPGSTGGSAILDYTVTSSPGGFTATGAGSPLTVTGLTNGTAYTFTVKARNAVGSSAASAASNSVTPVAAISTQYPRLLSPLNGGFNYYNESGTGPYSYAVAYQPANYGGMTTAFDTMAGDGYFIFRQEGYERMGLGLHNSATIPTGNNQTSPSPVQYAVFTGSGNYVPSTGGVGQSATNSVGMKNGGTPADGDWVRFKRVGTTVTVDVSKNLGSTWALVYTWTGVSGNLYPMMASGPNFSLMDSQGLS